MTEEVTKTVRCKVDHGFGQWISSAGCSIAITTYQAGKIALVGWTGSQVHVTMRDFPRPMGLARKPGSSNCFAMATQDELILFANAGLLAQDYLEKNRYDALFLPRISYHTGNLNLHDLAYGTDGLWAVNTRFGCLVTFTDEFSFIPRWNPPFLSLLAPEDRCHLNGLALADGQPAFATALGKTDTPRGWLEHKATGGILMDIPANRIILENLCMPHSPRWKDGKLWMLNSGLGELWIVNPLTGQHQVVTQLPGYLRGLDFVGHHALIGMSKIRSKHIFAGLPVQERCPNLTCGIAVVNTITGQCDGILEFTDAAEELYDVISLPGVFKPAILNRKGEDFRLAFTAPEFSYWMAKEEKPHALIGTAQPQSIGA
ncbi:MAG TPA: TIGR03032 family protein [Tepidisphaeraceae bacterium]|nr:TIGR03032 family protein [Tepidisphaeraceae bacterium]